MILEAGVCLFKRIFRVRYKLSLIESVCGVMFITTKTRISIKVNLA